jgi:translocator protein
MIKSWLIIGVVAVLVAVGVSRFNTPDGYRWFNRQQRPAWLTIEGLIPAIWTAISICGVWSAYIVWETSQSWPLMAGYLLLEVMIMVYSPLMFWLRSLRVGTIIGAVGWIFGLILALLISPVSQTAFFLLIPYLLWSPIGTYITWEMERLNN